MKIGISGMNQGNSHPCPWSAIINKFFPVWLFLSFSVMLQAQTGYSVNRIWDTAPHNAFTDLIKHKGRYFCTFREATAHVPAKDGTGDGKIRILVSTDGNIWESAALIAKEGLDLRDPKLSITPDGRLMVLIGASVYKNGQLMSQAPYVSFTDKKAKTFSDPQPVMLDPGIKSDRNWLWRVTWSKKTGYGVVYQFYPDMDWKVYLLKTSDGINYTLITQLDVPGKPNESTVEVLKDGRMRIIVRREETQGGNGYLGYSKKDYTKWEWRDLGIRLGGPDIITLPNGKTVIGSRSFRENKPHTALFGLDENGKAIELLELPSGNDTSYPGLLINNNELWVSYYSGHEGKTSIYLAKVKYKDLFIQIPANQ